MIVLLALWLQLASPDVQAQSSGGGGGVKNGAVAIRCEKYGERPILIELAEIRDSGGQVEIIEDRQTFFNHVHQRLRSADHRMPRQLDAALAAMLKAHGPSDQWDQTPFRIATIVGEDFWKIRAVRHINLITGVVSLKNGCELLPISYLTPSATSHPAPPQKVANHLSLLDPYNRNVVELHEALYEMYVQRNPHAVNVLPTRALIRAILDGRHSPQQILDAVIDFQVTDYLAPGSSAGKDRI